MENINRNKRITKIADNTKSDSSQTPIPAAEVWLFEDKMLLASFDKSVAESAKGRVIDRGTFSKYTKDTK